MRIIGLVFLVVILLTGCKEEAVITPDDQKMQEMLKMQLLAYHELMTFAYDQSVLADVINEEMNHWQNPQKMISFTIKNMLIEDQYVVGLFYSPTEWELSGRLNTERTFKMTNSKEFVTLEYEDYKDTLALEEFTFLLPNHHLQVLQVVLKEKQFNRITWRKDKDSWQVEIYCPMTPMLKDITQYFAHGDDHINLMNPQFSSYSATYNLHLELTENNNLTLERIQFTVDKEGFTVDQLEFDL